MPALTSNVPCIACLKAPRHSQSQRCYKYITSQYIAAGSKASLHIQIELYSLP